MLVCARLLGVSCPDGVVYCGRVRFRAVVRLMRTASASRLPGLAAAVARRSPVVAVVIAVAQQ